MDSPYGQKQGKIKEAYGLAKAAKEQQLAKQGVNDRANLEKQGREAGRASTLDNVRNLTGVPIGHVAEVNLAGFYDLATALGGVDVCLNHPVQDDQRLREEGCSPQRHRPPPGHQRQHRQDMARPRTADRPPGQ